MKNIKRLWKWLSPYKGQFLLTVLLKLVSAVGVVMSSLSIANIMNAVIRLNMPDFISSMLISSALFFAAILTDYWYNLLTAKIKENIAFDLRWQMIEAVGRADYNQYQAEKPETYAAMLVTDLEIVSTRILDMLFKLISNFMTLIASVVGLIYLHISLLITALVLAVLMMSLPSFFQNKMQKLAKAVAERNNELLVAASHWLGGFSVLNNFNARSYLLDKLQPPVQAVRTAKLEDANMAAFVSVISGLVSIVAQMGMIGLTGYLALNHVVTAGSILSTGNLAGMIFGPLGVLISFYSQFQSGFGSLDKIEATIEALTPDSSDQGASLTITGPVTIETEDLAVRFPDGRGVDLPDLSIHTGQNYAIVGPSGVGKSVFLNVLAKNIPEYLGHFRLNGTELSTLSERAVKDQVSYVPQSTYIFNLTAKENILLANPHASEELYQEVVQQAGLDTVFAEWVDGDRTLIGDLHTQISGGQAQRIGIARALIHQKPIMLFDEVTANLDTEVAHSIEAVIHDIPDRLKLSVTHRMTAANEHLYDEVLHFAGSHQ